MEKTEKIQLYFWILGIDISKQSIDARLIRLSDGQLFESKFHNNMSGFRHLSGGANKWDVSVIVPLCVAWSIPALIWRKRPACASIIQTT